ncbi:protease PrsW [Romboutsia weinsteinii]|uniref:Protease PrsW n=1 Tax=Romboutsia weinsteinii TaxID=2020949 RepID=A0A371IZY1_9FIRM|nr:PrsW family glutamic-type intramembrane protease [Romboutsia weinsteinii]RDY26069.1 protease PrsW [Romboutsia weinsteinii]
MKIEILVLALAPIIACSLWLYIKDKYEKEPIRLLIKYFLIGALMSFIGIGLEEFLVKINIFDGYYYIIYMSFIVAGLTEEGLKAIALIPNLLREKNFNEKLDGIIYSAYLSLGFATIENIIYILFEKSSQAFQVGLIRAVISVPTHMMFAIAMGYYVSKYKYENNKNKKREYMVMALLVPILSHGAFDFILMVAYKWAIVLFIIYLIFLWKINLDKLDDYVDNSKKRFFRRKHHR